MPLCRRGDSKQIHAGELLVESSISTFDASMAGCFSYEIDFANYRLMLQTESIEQLDVLHKCV